MMKKVLDQRGDAAISQVIGIVLAVLIVIAAAFSYSSLTGATTAAASADIKQTILDGVVSQWDSESHAASSVFIPSYDVFGNVNQVPTATIAGGAPAVANPGSHEIDFYTRGLDRKAKFWAYVYDAFGQRMIEYEYQSRDAAGKAQGLNQQGLAVVPMQKFSAEYILASDIPGINPFVNANTRAKGIPLTNQTTNLGYPGVASGNRLVSVDISEKGPTKTAVANPFYSRHIELLAGAAFAGQIVVAQNFTPPPSGPLTVNPNNLTFSNPAAGGQTITATELNYHRPFSSTPCVTAGGATIATVSGFSGPGPSATATVTPNNTVSGTCTFKVVSADQSASVTVTVNNGPLKVNPTRFTFHDPSAPAQGIGVSEAGYTGAISATACVTGSGAQIASVSGFGNGPSTNASVAPNGSGFGTCTFQVQTADQSVTVTVLIYAYPNYGLTVTGGPSGSLTAGQTTTFTPNDTLLNAADVAPNTPGAIPVGAAITSGPCTVSNPGQQPNGTTFTVFTSSAGSCGLKVYLVPQNSYERTTNSPQNFTINVGGSGAPPTPPATSPPGFPPATPAPPSLPVACTTTYARPVNWNYPTVNGQFAFVGPTLDNMYDSVTFSGTAGPKTPSGNVVWGFYDRIPATSQYPTRGAVLMSQNTDCTVTIVMVTESFNDNYAGPTYTPDFFSQLVWNVSNSPVTQVDQQFTGTNNSQTVCAHEYFGGSSEARFSNACFATERGPSPYVAETSLGFLNVPIDSVVLGEKFGLYTSIRATRWLLTPTVGLKQLSIPTIAWWIHLLTSSNGINGSSGVAQFNYVASAAWYGSGNPGSNGSGGLVIPH